MISLGKLTLDGWLSYDKAELDLGVPGVTFIKGNLGAGKSAIFEAVLYLLFGKTLRKKDSVNTLANLVLHNGYDISVTFMVDDTACVVQEVRGRPNHGLFFSKNGVDCRGKTDLDTRKNIQQTLNISVDDFKTIAFLGQRQTQILVDGSESERAQSLVSVFGLTRYDSIIDACSADIRKLTEEKAQATIRLAQNKDELASLEAALSTSLEDPPDEQRLESIKTKISKLEEKRDAVREAIDKINTAIGKMRAYKKQKAYAQTLREELSSLIKKIKQLEKPTKEQSCLSALYSTATQDSIAAENQIRLSKNGIAKCATLSDVCPITNKDCPVHVPTKYVKKTICKLQEEKAAAEKALSIANDAANAATEELSKLQEYNKAQLNIKSKKAVLSSITESMGEVTEDASADNLQRYQLRLKDLDAKTASMRARYAELSSALAVYTERALAQERVARALDEKEHLINLLSTQIESLTVDLQYLAAALAIFKKMKIYKIDLVLQVLNKNLKRILEQISEGEYHAEFVSQRETADKKKVLDKVNVLVYDNYKVTPIEMCSGGQSTEVGLSVLLSVWHTAQEISQKSVSSLWLDEVFGTLNEEVIDRVFESVLRVIKKSGATSVKVISHRALDSRLFDHSWYVIRKNGVSSVTTERA